MPQPEAEISLLLPREPGKVTFQGALSHNKTPPASLLPDPQLPSPQRDENTV